MARSARVSPSRLATLLGEYDRTPGPSYRALATTLRLLIIDGRIVSGTRLPSERDLATTLHVSRTTVASAYALLRERGYADARHGSGTTATLPHLRRGGAPASPGIPDQAGADRIDLTCAAISPAGPAVAEAYATAVDRLPRYLASHGYTATGLAELREAVADRYEQRGLATSPDQVIVTNGALAAVRLALVTLTRPGDRVLLEAPSYPNAIDAADRCALRPALLPLDHDGWDPGATATEVRRSSPLVAYLMPDFQNPTGHLMTEDRRRETADVLRAGQVTTIVDETTVELAYDVDEMPRPYAAFDASAVLVGSTSKAHWGGLRVGWLRAPHDLVAPMAQARGTLDLGTPLVEQVVASLLVGDADGLATQRATLRARRDRLVARVRDALPELTVPVPPGGMSLWMRLPARMSNHLVTTAARHGLLLAAGPRFTAGVGLDDRLRLPFTAEDDTLDEAVVRLAAAYAEARATAPTDARTAPGTLIA